MFDFAEIEKKYSKDLGDLYEGIGKRIIFVASDKPSLEIVKQISDREMNILYKMVDELIIPFCEKNNKHKLAEDVKHSVTILKENRELGL